MIEELNKLTHTVWTLQEHGVLEYVLTKNKEQYGKYCLVITEPSRLGVLHIDIPQVLLRELEELDNASEAFQYAGIEITLSAPKDDKSNYAILAVFEKKPINIEQEWKPIENNPE